MSVDTLARPLQHPRVTGLPAFTDNYIWAIRAHDGPDCAVVDPGDAAVVRRWLGEQGLRLRWILVTHHHFDHTGGIAALKDEGVTVIGPRHEQIPQRDVAVGDGDALVLPGLDLTLQVLDIPGHTAGHVGFHGLLDHQPVLFCGDTLFSAGCGRLFEGSAAELHDSLQRLARLPPATLVFCTHEYTLGNLRFAAAVEPGNADISRHADWARACRAEGRPTVPSDLAREARINPFLRTGVPAVQAAACAHAGTKTDVDAGVFALLRRWKDEFS